MLQWGALSEVANVGTYGSIKYKDENWRDGLTYKETFGSMMRHAVMWFLGEERDKESGCHHLAHVAWNALAILEFILQSRRKGLDNRAEMAPYQDTSNIKDPPLKQGQPVTGHPGPHHGGDGKTCEEAGHPTCK